MSGAPKTFENRSKRYGDAEGGACQALLGNPKKKRAEHVLSALSQGSSSALRPYLDAIKETLNAALCLQNFASQIVERHNKPEVEVGCVESIHWRHCAHTHSTIRPAGRRRSSF